MFGGYTRHARTREARSDRHRSMRQRALRPSLEPCEPRVMLSRGADPNHQPWRTGAWLIRWPMAIQGAVSDPTRSRVRDGPSGEP